MSDMFIERIGPAEFKLAGELDLAKAGDLDAFFEKELPSDGDVVLDLAEVEFMDSVAIGVFARAARTLEGRGRLVLVSPTRSVQLALETIGLGKRENIEVRLGPE